MIILSLLSLLLNFSTASTNDSFACNQLIEALANNDTGAMTYCNRYKIPVVDRNGKMMFDVGLQRNGNVSRLSLKPAMNCIITSSIPVTITFTDLTEFKVSQYSGIKSHIDILIDDKLRSKIMTDNILSIEFEGQKYSYNIVLKPNQGRVLQDVMNCLQN